MFTFFIIPFGKQVIFRVLSSLLVFQNNNFFSKIVSAIWYGPNFVLKTRLDIYRIEIHKVFRRLSLPPGVSGAASHTTQVQRG